jgi:hypothetical protein
MDKKRGYLDFLLLWCPHYKATGLRQNANAQKGKHQKDHSNNQEQSK